MDAPAPEPLSQPLSPEVRARAEALVRRYFAQCFWFRHPDAPVENENDLALIVHRLREYGGRDGWREAADLQRCR